MKRIFLLLLLLCIRVPGFGQSLGLPFSKFYSTNDYDGGIQNFAITQSTQGMIYVANNFGLLEYDGSDWRRYSLPNSTKIRDVTLDESGIIYVSGQAEFGYFQADNQGSLQYHSLLTQLPEDKRDLEEVWKILRIQGEVIFCTVHELFVFDTNLQFSYSIPAPSEFESYHLINNQLIINDQEQGLMTLENRILRPNPFGNQFADKMIEGIFPLSSSQELVVTKNKGFFEQSISGINPWDSSLPSAIQINAVHRLRDGSFAIGTQQHGLFLLDPNGSVSLELNKAKGLKNNSILSLFEDIGGNLWIGHNNGITLLELSLPFRLIDQFSGLSGTGYDAYVQNNQVFFGTNYGVFSATRTQSGLSPIQEVAGARGQVYQITSFQRSLLVGQNGGAISIQNGKTTPLSGPSGIWNFQALKNHPNILLSGSYQGLLLVEKNANGLQFLRKIKGFDESARLVEQDQNGTIWVAHGYKGIFKIQLNESLDSASYRFYGTESGLPTTLLNSVWKINNRLVFSTEYGLYTYDEEQDRFIKDPAFEKYFEHDFLATSMVEDPLGNIFFIGEHEVGVLEKQVNGTYEKSHQIFNKIKPFLNDDLQNISLIDANEVLFAANDGFIWYKLDKNFSSSASFPTLIRAVYLTGQADSLVYNGTYSTPSQENSKKDKLLHIPHSLANIRFEASNPIPNNESTTQFQYWLEGQEDGFGQWTTRNEKSFTNLREGDYTFHVRSKNIYGQISEASPYTFSVSPPWYRSLFAYLCYILIGIVVLLLGVRAINRRMNRRTAEIKAAQSKVILQKETDLKESKQEIERLKTEKLRAEIQTKNKELASSTMHLLNKNGFIVHTKTHLNTIIKKSKNQEVKNELKKIIQSIEKNLAGDRDWEQFQIHFDEVHGDFMNRFKHKFPSLSPQEIKLSAYLRMNLSSKEIANLMNITIRGVEIARYRLRKKINLERSENLQEFILKF